MIAAQIEHVLTLIDHRFHVQMHHAYVDTNAVDISALSDAEKALFMKSDNKHAFLAGRSALKKLCRQLSLSEDTALIAFPNKFFSLTHTSHHAIAMYCAPSARYHGLGIDMEAIRPLTHAHAAYFLSPSERHTYASAGPALLTQLWTIKEAAFKSDGDEQDDDFSTYQIHFQDRKIIKNNATFVFDTHAIGGYYFSACLKESNT